MRSPLRFSMIICGALFAIGCAAEASHDPESDAVQEPDDDGRTAESVHGTLSAGTELTTTATLNLRSGPSKGYSVVAVMPKGSKVVAVGGAGTSGFYKVRYGSKTGWAHGDYLERVATPPPPSGGSTPSCSMSFKPPTTCDGPSGYTSRQIPSNGLYSTSWFGCYKNPDGSIHTDPYDNCEFACGNRGLCPSGLTGPQCQARLRWFAADADRYGCGARIKVTSCISGKSVVLVTLDRGPNCSSIEKRHGAPVIDMSHDAMMYLFGAEYGGGDKKAVTVERVADGTALGPS